MTPRLQPGEKVLFQAHPAAWSLFPVYVLTLGLYELWRKAAWFMVTDQRVIASKGIVTRTQRSVPVDMIQDASVRTQLGVGTVVVSSAGGPLSAQRFGPMSSATANEMADVILAGRRQARERTQG
jgi:membrane protein YdbS with pleckstrin-like domain